MEHPTANRRLSALPTLLKLAIGLGGGVCLMPAHAAPAAQVQSYRFDIPAQSLDSALAAFSTVTRVQVLVSAELTQALHSPGLQGSYPQGEALARLLAGSGLSARYIDNDSVTLEKRGNADAALQLGATTVSGKQLGVTTEGTRSYTTGAVTIAKGEQKLKDIPQSVSVLTRQRMDDQNITTLTQAVEAVPGLASVKSPGPGMFIFSRGFDIESMQYDGVPVPRNVYALGSYITENMVIYDRMEVLRGSAALLQGANSTTGAINMVRKRPQAEPTVKLTAKAGSWDRYVGQADVGGALNDEGTIRGRAVVNYEKGRSFTDYVWNWEQTVYGAVDFDLSEDTTLGIGASNKKSHSRPYLIALPRYSDKTTLDLPRSTFTGSTWNRAMNDQTAVYLDLEHRFNDNWKLKAAAMAMNESNEATYQFIAGSVTPGTSTGPRYSDFATDFTGKSRGLDVYLTGNFEALSFEQSVLLGANYSKYTTNDAYARMFTPGVNIDDIDHHRPFQDFDSIADQANLATSTYDIRQKGLYGSWRVKLLDPLTLIVGARSSWYDFAFHQQNYFQRELQDYGENNAVQTNGKVTPFYGLVYALNDQWSAYGTYSEVFIPQTERTLDQGGLKPIEGDNYELGLKGELMDGQLNASLAMFRYIHKNRAVTDVRDIGEEGCGGVACSTAAGKVRSQGIEAELSGEVAQGLQVAASYTYNTTKFLEDEAFEGKVFAKSTPMHMLRLWADYQLPGDFSKFSVGGGLNSQSSTLSFDRAFEQSGFTVWSSRVAYQMSEEIALAVNVNNLFDKKYYIPAYSQVTGNNYMGDPRNFMFSVEYTPQF
ncbi:TonB-dependent siderophore receptor [Pseudomonas fontis]|uniref:TonB-dependent siderophore receptor n=1 Tax=Pseudomonas fontis TaxID=2942633 RepID=A0ABT5NRW5_9PSED|nr:TonB-dependent siderophore receptor [Pseudomonas fontis]MDD0973596.1 TonB-dependent siderophore receptor [Pseudomonas fontis]MDD0990893.1 TonB-dependent siderophore receptor [Pseudomonas fontis]